MLSKRARKRLKRGPEIGEEGRTIGERKSTVGKVDGVERK
jgi:hypothetical protein